MCSPWPDYQPVLYVDVERNLRHLAIPDGHKSVAYSPVPGLVLTERFHVQDPDEPELPPRQVGQGVVVNQCLAAVIRMSQQCRKRQIMKSRVRSFLGREHSTQVSGQTKSSQRRGAWVV